MFMKKIAAFIVVAGLLVGGTAMADDSRGYIVSKVTKVRIDKNGKGYITFAARINATGGNSRATCVETNPDHVFAKSLSFDSTTDQGKAIMSIGLAALMSGKRIEARGTALCPHFGGVEEWQWGNIIVD